MDAALPSDAAAPDDVVPPALSDLLAALGPGDPQPVGRFRVDITSDTWWWSDEVYEMHGFAPGEVVPTTALVLSHKHPEDRERVASELAQAARTGEPFGSMHRIVDATGRTRTLAVAAQGLRRDDALPWAAVVGYFVDLTTAHEEAARREATASIRAADESRAAIEVNGSPHRLDLPPQWVREARSRNIPFVVSTDAHSTSELAFLPFGVAMARRGRLRRGEVLNTLEADAFRAAVRPAA